LSGSRGAAWLTVAMAVSALGALHVVVLTGARIPYAMARDGVFFRFAEHLHPSLRTPTGALVFLGSIAALLALSGTFEELYSLLPRLGISVDAAHLFGCRDGFDGQLVDDPARTLLAGAGSNCSRYSVFLPLAQKASCRQALASHTTISAFPPPAMRGRGKRLARSSLRQQQWFRPPPNSARPRSVPWAS